MTNIDTKTFKTNQDEAFAFITSVLRTNPSYEDGQYYFHFTADENDITAFNNYRDAEVTVTTAISVEDMCDEAGIEHDADIGDILANFEETARFDEIVKEIYDEVIEKI